MAEKKVRITREEKNSSEKSPEGSKGEERSAREEAKRPSIGSNATFEREESETGRKGRPRDLSGEKRTSTTEALPCKELLRRLSKEVEGKKL